MQLANLGGDRLAQLGRAGGVGVERVPRARRRVHRSADELGHRHVGVAVTELDRARHRLGGGGKLDERRFDDGGELRTHDGGPECTAGGTHA